MTDRKIKSKRNFAKLVASGKPMVRVSKSNKNLVAQLFDVEKGKTLFSMSTSSIKKGTKTEKAASLGKEFAAKMTKEKVTEVVFNRNGNLYHGRIKAFGDSLRENNIKI